MSRTPEELALMALAEWWTEAGAPPERMPTIARSRPLAPMRRTDSAFTQKTPARQVKPASPPPRRLRIDPVLEARKTAASAATLEDLRDKLNTFTECDLRQSAHKTVFSDGAHDADVMIIGDPPERAEDAAGIPFVGRPGQLLDRMCAAIGLTRRENLYITSMMPWHLPGDRAPAPEEFAMCAPFLQRQIELVAPRLIIAVGKHATHFLLNAPENVIQISGRRMTYQHEGLAQPITCVPFLAPGYLLKRPADKARAWRDLQQIEQIMEELGVRRAPAI